MNNLVLNSINLFYNNKINNYLVIFILYINQNFPINNGDWGLGIGDWDYIDKHFEDIAGKSSVIESRQEDSDCTIANLKENNRQCCEGFLRAGERVTMIDESFEKEMETLLDV